MQYDAKVMNSLNTCRTQVCIDVASIQQANFD
jgi:hypothetical protein